MDHLFDEFSKSLSESVPRRESLRRLGAVFAGAVLTPLASVTAWAAGKPAQDPCRAFCKCRNKSQQNQCLAACSACNGNTNRLCGYCGSYACTNLASDFNNCGACGHACDPADPYEEGACINGACLYRCVEGAGLCNGICTVIDWDPDNCGACGNVCPESAPYCSQGVCFDPGCAPGLTYCGSVCVDLNWNQFNCGACGNACTQSESCSGGQCQGICVGCELKPRPRRFLQGRGRSGSRKQASGDRRQGPGVRILLTPAA